ncbi:MAG: ROK family protein [Ignavibacteria bacterium]
MANKSIVSIDMGGTKILASIVNSKDGITNRVKVPTKQNCTNNEYAEILASVVDQIMQQSGISKNNIAAVCLGVPGTVNPYTGLIGLATNIGMENFNIKEALEKKLSFPVIAENDVNLGALGIYGFGVGKKAKNLLAVFIGTGIGGGLIIDGKIHRGSGFSAAEIGHFIVNTEGRICTCGRRGCFETIASRTAIVRQIIKDVESGKESIFKRKVSSGEKIKSKAIANAIMKNDKITVKRVTAACDVIGQVLANVSDLINMDTIVLGGGMVEAMGDFLLPKIENAYNNYVFKSCGVGVKILISELGDDAAIWGGISLAEEFLGVKV